MPLRYPTLSLEDIILPRALRVLCTALLFCGLSAWGATDRPVTIDTWTNHPGIKEVRAIYNEIESGIKQKKYRTTVRRFDIHSPLCATYPVKSETLTVDSQNRPRLYRLEQLGSHGEPFTVGRYYDAKGSLRFVYVDRSVSSLRIYLNGDGDVFWAVEKNADKFTAFDSKSGDWETKPRRADGAREAFQERQLCPEIKK